MIVEMKMTVLTKIAGWLVGATCLPLMGARFATPAEGPVAFRRDRIPLDAGAMVRLSRQLVFLARGVDPESATELRAAAQMLALSTALNPANGEARQTLSDFQHRPFAPIRNSQVLEKSRALVWQYLAWLETPAAGDQGNALAACLMDAIVVADPTHPKAKSARGAPESGAWAGWVPELAAFEDSKAEPAKTAAVAENKPFPVDPEPLATGILLSQAAVSTPLWRSIPKTDPVKWTMAPAVLEMVAEMMDTQNSFLVIGTGEEGETLHELAEPLETLLNQKHGSLPKNFRLVINSRALEASMKSGRRQSISGAAAVLANAAMTGREPIGTVIGTVDAKGGFSLPQDLWAQLHSLELGEGGRLVLPAAAADYLLSILALERPEFFLKYEVLLANDFDQLIALAEKNPGDATARSIAKFGEIRSKATGQPVGQYVSNSFVRRRLAEIVQEAPYHYSAKMLALQGAGNRPTSIPRQVMVAELRKSIEPMVWLMRRGEHDFEADELTQLGGTYESCRSEVDRMIRYAEKTDRELINHVLDMLAGVRSMERIARNRVDPASTLLRESHNTLVVSYKKIAREFAVAAGEPLEDGEQPPP
jgi:hypothetical protein